MELNTFQIAQNQQNIEYFAYVREVMQAKQIPYWIGNPSAQILNGTIYLKPCPNIDADHEPQNFEQYLKLYRKAFQSQKEDERVNRSLILIGIPNSKNPIQVCQRLSAYLDWIIQIRVIKTNHFKFYAMLLFMKDHEKSKKIQQQIDGDQYNSLQIQRLLIREMESVCFTHTETTINQNQPIYQHWNKSPANEGSLQKLSIQKIFLKSNNQSPQFASSPRKKQHFFKNMESNNSPLLSSTQNQNSICTICFEQGQGTLISILCSHYFHVKCLSQWKQNICPLCRYHQHPPLIKFCEKCNECQGLWVCLVCGVRLCCGFDHDILGNDSHIYQHYLQSQHRLSMQLQTKFIFDASQPAFLHQMLYREVLKNDGGEKSQSQSTNKKGKMTKLNQKISQYEQSISEQMQKQRIYFQQNINKEIKKRKQNIKEKKKKVTQLQSQINQISKQISQADTKRQQLQKSTINLQKELKIIEDVKKYWSKANQKYKKQLKQKQQGEGYQIKKLEQMISQKKEELKDYRRNKQLTAKIKSNVGKDQVQTSIIFGMPNKDNKKKKK